VVVLVPVQWYYVVLYWLVVAHSAIKQAAAELGAVWNALMMDTSHAAARAIEALLNPRVLLAVMNTRSVIDAYETLQPGVRASPSGLADKQFKAPTPLPFLLKIIGPFHI
jgi:hypothetical protein